MGKDLDKLNLCIDSIESSLKKSGGRSYEIIVVGENLSSLTPRKGLTLVTETDKREYLGYKRNLALDLSHGENLIFCDDDIVFTEDWVENFINYISDNPDWQISGNRILLPYGGRYWDRATYYPRHTMVDYDYKSKDDLFYQGGCFVFAKRSLMEQIRWDGEIPFYATSKGYQYNEDVEFSVRLKKMGVQLGFDKNNLVWHYDRSYICNDYGCTQLSGTEVPMGQDKQEFKNLIKKCKN